MEGTYGVYFGNQQAGKVQVLRQGLYWRFVCRCQLSGEVVCRLHVLWPDKRESLGVVVPMDGGFGLDTRLPVKHMGKGTPEFILLPKHDAGGGRFVSVYPEEPFSYIERLKEAYLARKDGDIGLILPQ